MRMGYDVILFRGDSLTDCADATLIRLAELSQKELNDLTRIMQRQTGTFMCVLPWREDGEPDAE